MSKPGRVRVALAKKLQAQFPSVTFAEYRGGPKTTIPMRWLPEHLYPSTGFYRTNSSADCARWEGSALGVREDGSTYTMRGVYGWQTMSDLIKPGDLTLHADGQVTNESTA